MILIIESILNHLILIIESILDHLILIIESILNHLILIIESILDHLIFIIKLILNHLILIILIIESILNHLILIILKVMGLAVYNGEMLDIRFPPCVYKKLLSPEIVPSGDDESKKNVQVGVVKSFTLLDLKLLMPSLAASLQQLLDYEGNVRDDFMLSFQVSFSSEFDQIQNIQLKENGHEIELTSENRKEFVDLYADYLLNKSIYEKFKAFYYGFHSVCASNALIVKFKNQK